MDRTTLSLPRMLLHLEGLIAFVGAIALYVRESGSLWLFLLLLLVPDVGMIGYLKHPKMGALTYNLVHTYALPASMVALSFLLESELALHIALIWYAHIGMDRMLGYGLKYPTQFQDTHLNRV